MVDTVKRINFVAKCGELLVIAKPHLVKCELVSGKSISSKPERYEPDFEYVLITCDNGYSYKICVEATTLVTIASEIFSKMTHK